MKTDDKLSDLLMDMENPGWEQALQVIRKHVISEAVKAEIGDGKPKGDRHVVNNMSGETQAASQSPGSSKKKYDKEHRGREKSRQSGESSNNRRQSRSKSGTRVCYNCDEMTDHWASSCPRPKKVGAADEKQRNHTPYPRPRSHTPSAERGEASQGSNTFRMIRGSWG